MRAQRLGPCGVFTHEIAQLADAAAVAPPQRILHLARAVLPGGDGPRDDVRQLLGELLDALAGFAGTAPVTVRLDPASDSVSLRRDDVAIDVGAATTGNATTFAIDPSFMRQAAESAIGPELVIEAGDEASPVLFRSANDGTYTSLVMPFIV